MSIYQKIGGEMAVNAAVTIFYKKVLADERIGHFFESLDMAGQIQKQKAFLTYAFGGPNSYTGKDMRAAHRHMNLTEEHFDAVAENLVATLEELAIAKDIIDEIVQIILSVKDDVLDIDPPLQQAVSA